MEFREEMKKDGLELRKRAEEAVQGQPEDAWELSQEEMQHLIHELRVHQIELEMQNEELRRAQLEMEASRNRYSDLYDFAPVGYLTTSEKGLILEANLTMCNMLGVVRGRLIGKPIYSFITKESQNIYYLHRQKLFETKDKQTWELALLKRDGSQFDAQLECIVIEDDEGNITQTLTAITDISDRKRAEDELRKHRDFLEEMVEERTKDFRALQEQMVRQEKLATLGQLAGGVAHELRNPLCGIKNAAYFLNMSTDNPDAEVKEAIEILNRELTTADNIIQSLFDYADPKKPRLELDVSINERIREALFYRNIPEDIDTVTELDEDLPSIKADPEQLDQVLNNLIRNAIQAMREGGQLIISSQFQDSGWIVITIKDTGEGIQKESLTKIFQPLFTTKPKGIGLGLALCKNYIEGHGGKIRVDSEVGKGTNVKISFPIGNP
jgi:PAS domain S-box-containing protein